MPNLEGLEMSEEFNQEEVDGDNDIYRKGYADGVQEVIDYMVREVGYCNFGE